MIQKTSLETLLIKNYLFKGLIVFLSLLMLLPLLFILFFVLKNGISQLSWAFLSELPKPVGDTGGGVLNAWVGSLLLLATTSVLSVPLGIWVGIYLSEARNSKLAFCTRFCVDLLQGIPSIVMGIIAYIWVVVPSGHFSAFSGSVALSLLMIPLIVTATEETLKLIPNTLKEASLALGVPYWKTVLKVLVPTGFNGILTGILLSLSRIAGETAPLLFTAFGSPFLETSIFKPVQSLPLLIFNYATSPYEDWQRIGWGASCLLILSILGFNILAKVVKRS